MFYAWASLLVAPGRPLEAPGAQNEVMLNTACVSQSGPKMMKDKVYENVHASAALDPF